MVAPTVGELLEIAARGIDAPHIVIATAAMKPKLKRDVTSVGTCRRIAIGSSLFGCNHTLAACRRLNPIDSICLVADQLPIRRPGEIGERLRLCQHTRLSAGASSRDQHKVPSILTQNRSQRA